MTSNEIDAVQGIQGILNNLRNKMESSAEETFKAAIIAQHLSEVGPSMPKPMEVDSPVTLDEHTQHEDLQRIADHVRQEQAKADEAALPQQSQAPETSPEQHEVLKHIGSSDSSSTLATVPITPSSEPAPVAAPSAPAPVTKPPSGSEEWHKMRRDNHKEVERRRRGTINQGINDLATIIACTEKNKGQILKEVVKYIQSIQLAQTRLTEEVNNASALKIELANVVLEKQVAEAALDSLSMHYDQLKRDYEALLKEREAQKREQQEQAEVELAHKKPKLD
ncbi:basic helix-loop-helix protein [Podila epigama]|nr:basic helix-loop-helix protein [Podila epigama]